MNCREASVQISLHVGDDLPAADVPALENHLEQCALCESDYESYASARDALQLVADEYSGTTDLWGEIESQIGADQGAGSAASTAKRAWYRHPVFASGMAAALLIAASSPFWSGAKSAGEAAVGELAESASVPGLNVGLGIPDVTPS
ncbi:MAG: anti-sigma factor family protein, partial [Planctomycetota bacterium]